MQCPTCDCIVLIRSLIFEQWWCENCLKWFIESEYPFINAAKEPYIEKETPDDSQDS